MLPKAPHKLVESPRSALNRRTWTPWAEGVPIVVEGSQGRRMHLTLFCITDPCSAMKPCFDAFCTLVFSLLREILSAALDDQLIEHHRLCASWVSSILRGWQSNPRAGRRNGLQGSFPPSRSTKKEQARRPRSTARRREPSSPNSNLRMARLSSQIGERAARHRHKLPIEARGRS